MMQGYSERAKSDGVVRSFAFVPVKNGKEMKAMLIEQGFKFKSSDSTSFCEPNVYGCSVLGAEGLYGHHLTLFRDYNYNDNTVRMSGFEISLQLEYDFV